MSVERQLLRCASFCDTISLEVTRWQSGYAPVCRTGKEGSNPSRVSKTASNCPSLSLTPQSLAFRLSGTIRTRLKGQFDGVGGPSGSTCLGLDFWLLMGYTSSSPEQSSSGFFVPRTVEVRG